MAKVRFYLKNHLCKNTSIFMVFHFGASKITGDCKKYRPLKYYINETINPAHWNKHSGRAKEQKKYPQYSILNERLRIIENTVHSIFLNFKNNNIYPTNEQLRKALDNELLRGTNGEQTKEGISLFSFIDTYIAESVQTKSFATIVQYKNTLRILKDFAKKKNESLNFEDINLAFYAKFKQYMNDLNYSEAYFGNQIRFLRLFMNEATERGYNKQLSYKSRKFTGPLSDTVKIYLTVSEIKKIQTLDLSFDPLLEQVRDLFIIAYHTGLRYSDLMQLKHANFLEDGTIVRIETQKTKELIFIPIASVALDLCTKYNYQLPCISNSLFNYHIKKIGHIAGLDEEVEILLSKGNQKKRQLFKKHELISAHTARRSFATNAYLAGVSTIAIMRVTGHRTEKAFMKYIRISGESNARQLLLHPYFLKDKEAS
jgi:integrase